MCSPTFREVADRRCCCSRRWRRNLKSKGLPGQQSPAISKSNAVHNHQSNIHSANSESRVRAIPAIEEIANFSLILLFPPSIYTSPCLLPFMPFSLRFLVLFFFFCHYFSSSAKLLLFPLPPLMLHLFSYSSLLISSTSFVSSSFSLLFLVIFVVPFCFLFLYPCPSFCCTFYFSFPVLI